MFKVTAVRSLLAAAAAALSLVAAPAQAAVVVASFDPAVGPSMPGFGFRGTAQFTIDDACLALTGVISSTNPCTLVTPQPMFMQSASVEFYDLLNPTPTLATATFGPGAITIFSAEIAGGEVIGLNTAFADPLETVTLPPLPSPPQDSFVRTVALGFTLGDGPNVPAGARLLVCDRGGQNCTESNTAINVKFTTTPGRLPEPATLALVALAALGAAGASRRRA